MRRNSEWGKGKTKAKIAGEKDKSKEKNAFEQRKIIVKRMKNSRRRQRKDTEKVEEKHWDGNKSEE